MGEVVTGKGEIDDEGIRESVEAALHEGNDEAAAGVA